MKDIGKYTLPILDRKVRRFAGYCNSFPHSTVVLLNLTAAGRIIGSGVAHCYFIFSEVSV